MLKVLIFMALFVGMAAYFRIRKIIILITLGLSFIFILFLILVLPEGNIIKNYIGSSVMEWLILVTIVFLVGCYGFFLRAMKNNNLKNTFNKLPDNEMSETEIERYARHIILKEIGGQGQQKLRDSKVLIVGAGGLGNPVSMYLAGAGVGTIGIIDDDEVSLSNLQRQILYRDTDIGKSKVFASQKNLLEINPYIIVKPYNRVLDINNAQNLISEYDLIVDGTDNIETRHLINLACVREKKPLISGAISQWEGQISLFDPSNNSPCYSCIFPKTDNDSMIQSCAEVGVLGGLPGVIGSIMAVEVVKEITGIGKSLRGFLLLYDALSCEIRKIKADKDVKCKICG